MGFYQPFTIIKDAQRHGLEVNPIDITCSAWLCTLESGDAERGRNGDGETRQNGESIRTRSQEGGLAPAEVEYHSVCGGKPPFRTEPDPQRYASPRSRVAASPIALRLGLKYVKGLRAEAGEAIVRERLLRPFAGIDDLRNRVPELRKDELRKLAAVGALNFIQNEESPKSQFSSLKQSKLETWDLRLKTKKGTNRRDALWQVERVSRAAGPLFRDLMESDADSPLMPMTLPERLDADFRGTGLTIGQHPVAHHRSELHKLGVLRATDIREMRDGTLVRVAGWVIVRQRPGTAKGFVFLSLEDETGVSNIIITPQLFDKNRLVVVDHPFLLIEGQLQNQDNVVSVKAKRIRPFAFQVAANPSHDFH
jgi:error-prone DNA polymerase